MDLTVNKIVCGNCREELKKIPDDSINCSITSPPYWALRVYGTNPQIWDVDNNCKHKWGNKIIHRVRGTARGMNAQVGNQIREISGTKMKHGQFCIKCGAWRGELGCEPIPELYIKHLCDIYDEIKRILRPDGTCWVNLADTYAGSGCGTNDYRTEASRSFQAKGKRKALYKTGGIAQKVKGISNKSLCLIPERFSIEMVNRGWILRNVIIWYKPNAMPSSAKDRFTVDYEYIFFLVKSKKYIFEQQFEEYTAPLDRWGGDNLIASGKSLWCEGTGRKLYRRRNMRPNPKGRNKRCVWKIPTSPFKDAHFAVFPEKLVEPMIKAGCPEGGIILDPFFGSGTVGVVAAKYNRRFIGIELNPEYIQIAKRRIQAELLVT